MWDQLVIGAPRWMVVAVGLVATAAVALAWSYYRGSRVGGLASGRLAILAIAATLKFVGIVALAICLVEPLFSGVRPRPGANVFGILVDNSHSMQVSEPGSKRSRGDQLRRQLDRKSGWQTRLRQDFDVRGYVFDTSLSRVDEFRDLDFAGTSSSLGDSLRTVASRFGTRPVAGMLLFSDGNDTSEESGDRDWSQLGFPVYPIVDGSDEPPRDLLLGAVNVAQSNFETAPVTVSGEVRATGLAGKALVIRLVDEQQEQVAEQSAEAPADGEVTEYRFRFRPRDPGVSFYTVHAFLESERNRYERDASLIEATLANNRRVLTVNRGGGPYRVLYVSGRPNWEFKFLRRAMQEDVEVQLVGLMRIAKKEPKFVFGDQKVTSDNPLFQGFDGKDPDEKERYDQPVLLRLGVEGSDELRDGFPATAAQLFAYDAVILDDLEADFFKADQLLLLRQFVATRGGGLLLLGGQESFHEGGYDRTALGELSPIYLDRASGPAAGQSVRFQLTREGWLQPWTRVRSNEVEERQRLDSMPGFKTLNRASDIKPGASILATVTDATGATQRPALVAQRFGKGRSAALLVGDMWRWGMHRPQDGPQDLQQAWRQTIRWLVSDVPRRVEIKTALEATPDRPMQIEVTVRDEEYQPLSNASVTLRGTTPDEQAFELTAEPSDERVGVYVATFWPRADGAYRVTAIASAEDGSEIARSESGWTAQPSAAEFRRLSTNRRLLDEIARQSGGEVIRGQQLEKFVAGIPNRKVPVTEQWVYPLWHQPWLFGLAILCLCGEWGLRRWKGLP